MTFVGNIFTQYIKIKKISDPPQKQNVPLNIVDWDTLASKLEILDQTLGNCWWIQRKISGQDL